MKILWIVSCILFGIGIVACGSAPFTASPQNRAEGFVTAAPTESVPPSQITPDLSDVRQATGKARATAQPFPTTQPVTITRGQRIVATAQRDGVTLEVVLDTDTFWASQFAQADVSLKNDSGETIFYEGSGKYKFYPRVKNERGEQIVEEPTTVLMGGSGGSFVIDEIPPGKAMTQEARFQLPARAAQNAYSLWVNTTFFRASTADATRGDGVPLELVVGPIPLTVLEPDAAHQLRFELQADADGYDVRVTNALGEALHAPVYGLMRLKTAAIQARFGFPMADGHVQSHWSPHNGNVENGELDVWVWGENYAVAHARLKIPGQATGD